MLIGVVVAKRHLALAQETHRQSQETLEKNRRRSERIEATVADLKRDVDSRVTRIVDRFIGASGLGGDRWRRWALRCGDSRMTT